MNSLPNEIVTIVLSNITDLKSYWNSSLVCKKWWQILKRMMTKVADENAIYDIKYLPFPQNIFTTWEMRDIPHIKEVIRNDRRYSLPKVLHGNEVIYATSLENPLMEKHWRLGKPYGEHSYWMITAGHHTIYIDPYSTKLRTITDTRVWQPLNARKFYILNYNENGNKDGDEIFLDDTNLLLYSCQWQDGKKHGVEFMNNREYIWIDGVLTDLK